jgi:hypothetical protein
MWGWELGATNLSYQNSGWVVATTNAAYLNYAQPSPMQPAAGYGGGRYSLGLASNGSVATPAAGSGSLGTHQRFIFHDGYLRTGNTGHPSWTNSAIFKFYSGGQEILRIAQSSTQYLAVSPILIYEWNGAAMALLGTSTTTFTGGVWRRIVIDIDGGTGDYDIYIDGVLEISVTGMGFTSIDTLFFAGGAHLNLPSGGSRHDHCVLFDGGNHATGSLMLATNPTDGDTVTVGGTTYLFKTALTATINEVLIGATAAESARNLTHAINLGPGSGTWYDSNTVLNSVVFAEIDLSVPGMYVEAKVKGVDVSATTSSLTAGGDGWAAATLTGGDLDATGDLALALGQIFIQGQKPNGDVIDGAYLNKNGANDGTNTDMYLNIDDATNLTDFIETVTTPDANEFAHEDRADINAGWLPSEVHAVQSLQISRGSGAITEGRTTIDIPSLGKTTSPAAPVSTAGKIQTQLRNWRAANTTTDLDGIKSGYEV